METEAVSITTSSTCVIDVVNSKHFRVIFADDISIGLSPAGMINLDFANDREAPPRRVTYTYDANGDLMDAQLQSDADIVREVEISVIMNRMTAMQLRDRLAALLEDEEDESDFELESASSDISDKNVDKE